MNDRLVNALLTVALLSSAGTLCSGQTTTASPALRETPRDPERSIEDLNLVGAAATMPRVSDSLLGTESGFRRALFGKGILIRANVLPRFSVNLLDGPVPASQQVYIGQRPTWITGLNPILTADLRQLHLHNAQLNIGGAWRWTTWNPAGPKTIALSTLYLYKMWRDHLFEMKVGYITATSARRAQPLARRGCGPGTCTTALTTRTRSRGERNRATTAHTSSWTTSFAGPGHGAPARDSSSVERR